ncbi:MAG TPA: MmpS family transport accessory protein [Sporichthyaceae bacterium]|jgi:hypothetical protein|nr:MmpS family transport accessory protein [Sporichthyaceae bacterium]
MTQSRIAKRKPVAPLRRPRRLRYAAGLTVAVVVAGTALAWHPWSSGSAADTVYTTSTAKVTYEVLGSGTSPRIEFVNGPDNATDMARHQKLPWQKTLSIPVGLAGAVADMTAAYPDSGQPVRCRILVNGKVVRETLSSDGYSDAACSTVVPAAKKR